MPLLLMRNTAGRRRRNLFLLLAGLTLLALCVPGLYQPRAQAATVYTVNTLGDTPDNFVLDGICNDGSGNCSLRAAIQQGVSVGGTVVINFSVNGTINLTTPLPDITDDLTISGPGASLLTVRRDTGGNYRIFTITSNRTVSISGLTITNGRAPDGAATSGSVFGNNGADGGGISNLGNLTLTDVVVTGNRAGDGGPNPGGEGGVGGSGGGISSGGRLQLTNVVISNNAAGNGGTGDTGERGGTGGGVSSGGNVVTMTNVTINNNRSGNAGLSSGSGGASGGDGGGASIGSIDLTLTNVTIRDNATGNGINGGSGGSGGGLYSGATGQTRIMDSVFSNNTTGNGGGTGGRGGGIYNNGGGVIVTRLTVSGNSTGNGSGGGIYNNASLTMLNSTVSGNSTHGNGADGAGIYHNGHQLLLINSTISSNQADPLSGHGGGLYNNGTSTTLTNLTITGNTAYTCCVAQSGQGIHDSRGLTIRNTIVAGNGNGNTPDVTGTFNSHGHNLVGRATPGNTGGNNGDQSGFTNGQSGDIVGTISAPIDLRVGPLADNGGPTLTHALLDGSPALDAGNNSLAIALDGTLLTTDQRGAGRFGGAGHDVDIGAYEFHPPAVADLTDKSTNEDTPLAASFSVGDGSASVASITATSGNQTLVPDAGLVVSGSGQVRTLQITPAANQSGSAQITVTVNYTNGTVSSGSFQLTVTPVNDLPSFTKGADQTVAEDAGPQTVNNWATAISPGPNEASQTVSFVVTDNSNVSLFSVGPIVNSSGTLIYTTVPNASGSATITLVVTDNGGTANGGQDTSAPQTFNINVTPVNDAPVNTVPAAQTTDQNTSLVFSNANANAISVADIDAGTDPLRVALSVTNGTLTLNGTAGLTFIMGDGTDDAALTFNGTLNNLNAALNGLVFKPTAGFNGTASFQITTNDQGFNGTGGALTDTDSVNITVRPGTIEFKQSSYTGSEGGNSLAVVVRRTGDTSQAALVAYATDDGSIPSVSVPCSATTGAGLDRCDFTKALGRIVFPPGETERTINILIGDDSYIEGTETALIRLTGISGVGVVLGSRTVATLEITDDLQEPSNNPIDATQRFVRQHYQDFLNREPDASGLAFWTNEIEQCGADAQCREVKRINVSAAFFLSIEFQQTGYLVYRLDKVAFGNISSVRPVPVTLNEFLLDTQNIGQGLVVGADGWEQTLEENKRAFVDAFVLRARFQSQYPSTMTAEQYVDSLNANAGGVLLQAERDALVADLRNGVKTRAQVLRAVAEHQGVVRREFNQAFVLMEYFGYLRRDPDSAPDTNFNGYNFWLGKLNEFNGNYIAAEMVKAFISSDEYRKRFGQ